MEGSQVTSFSEISAEADDPLPETSQKRMYKPSAKIIQMDEPGQSSKQQKMVLTDDLLTFLGETIQGDPDSWGIMLTKSWGKGNVQLKLIQHLAKHTNLLTQGKTSTVETVPKGSIQDWSWLRRKQLAEQMEELQEGKFPMIKFQTLSGSGMILFSIMPNGRRNHPQLAGTQLHQYI
jgi:hypothetical protein